MSKETAERSRVVTVTRGESSANIVVSPRLIPALLETVVIRLTTLGRVSLPRIRK